MKAVIRLVVIAVTVLAFSPAICRAQALNGRGVGKAQVIVAYYKTPPGRQDEWLALYKKYHRPIMDYQIEKGVTTSSILYAAGTHSRGQPWDFAIITVSPPADQSKSLGISRAALIRKLFPDLEDYVKGEKQRWALTIEFWNDEFVEMDLSQDPLSVFEPIDPPKVKQPD